MMATVDEMDNPFTIKEFMLTYLMPEKCYETFFANFNFLHVPCLNIVLSKTVGMWILLGTVFAPLPQLLKVIRGRSADGLSLTSVYLQLYAVSGPVVYCMAHNFPLSAWVERLFMLLQTAAIVFLILYYRCDPRKGMFVLLAYSGVVVLLVSFATGVVISMIQASSVIALTASKVSQASTNYSNSRTGQLSSLSVLLVWAGSLGLIFVSLQETGKSLSTVAHIMSACISCVLMWQVLCYKNSSTAIKKKCE